MSLKKFSEWQAELQEEREKANPFLKCDTRTVQTLHCKNKTNQDFTEILLNTDTQI